MKKPFTSLAAVVFAGVCAAHAVRLCLGWEVTVHGAQIPLWLSGLGMVVTAGLSVMLWRESRER